MNYFLDNPEKAVDIAKAKIPELATVDRDKSIQTIVVLRPTRSRTGLFDVEDMQKYVPLAVKAGLVKGQTPNGIKVTVLLEKLLAAGSARRL